MRSLARPRRREEEEESVFISVTDLTVSFLFVLMILMAFFAARYNPDDVVPLEELRIVEAERDSLRIEVGRLAGALEEAARREAGLREALVAQETELQRLLEALRRSQDDAETADALAARLTREREALIREIAAAEGLRDDLARLADLLAQQRVELKDARRLVVDLQSKLDDLERTIEARDVRISFLEREVTSLRDALAKAQVSDPLERYLQAVSFSRQIALQRLRDAIEARFPDLDPQISDDGALRFQGEGLFASGSPVLTGRRREIVEGIAEVLDEVLACYALGPRAEFNETCNPGYALVEALQIEGHTDSRGNDLSNMRLSTARAVETFAVMTTRQPGLFDHLNREGETVLAVSGYGERRPVAQGEAAAALAQNRRIDLRFIMLTPERAEEIDAIRDRLSEALR